MAGGPSAAAGQGALGRGQGQVGDPNLAMGGPAQIDTFDPKPGLGNEYNGPFGNTQTTGIPGVAALDFVAVFAGVALTWHVAQVGAKW